MPEFHKTAMGRKYYDYQLPALLSDDGERKENVGTSTSWFYTLKITGLNTSNSF